MRRLIFGALVAMLPGFAVADESISGQWEAHLDKNVFIAMDVLVDGHWSSQTVQNNRVIAAMSGTYKQEKTTPTVGTLVFTPEAAKVAKEHGQAVTETDHYELLNNNNTLKLDNGKVLMTFERQPLATERVK
jgi:hypothetical protein